MAVQLLGGPMPFFQRLTDRTLRGEDQEVTGS